MTETPAGPDDPGAVLVTENGPEEHRAARFRGKDQWGTRPRSKE